MNKDANRKNITLVGAIAFTQIMKPEIKRLEDNKTNACQTTKNTKILLKIQKSVGELEPAAANFFAGAC